MAGKKKPARNVSPSRSASMPRALSEAIDTASALLERKRLDDALELLTELDRRFPNHFTVLQLLARAAYETGDDRLFLDSTERLVAIAPDDSDFLQQRAFAHARMGFVFLAQRYFQQVVQRFPDTPN